MKIVVAPDSFKGSLTAIEVSDAIEQGVREIFPEAEIIKIPMADGGDGTVQCLVNATGGRRKLQVPWEMEFWLLTEF